MRTTLSVAPWIDEVMQVDAGVNLYLGAGWVSTAWQSQSEHEFWAANNPLYAVLVYLWISALGFTPVAVRSLNFVLALVVTWSLVDTCGRAGWVRSTWARAALAALLICDQAVTFVYRSGRADLVTMLTVVLLLRSYVGVVDPLRRRVLLFCCALLALPSGLHGIPYVVLLLGLEYAFTRRLRGADLIVMGAGGAAGGLALAALFAWKRSLTAYVSQTFASGYNILGAGLQAALIRDQAAVNRLLDQLADLSPVNVVEVVAADASLLPPILFLLAVLLALRRESGSRARFSAAAGVVAAALIPYGMLASGRYPFYYAWMGAAPVIVAFAAALESVWIARRRLLSGLGAVAAAASLCLGMPSVVWQQVLATAPDRYSEIERFLCDTVQRGDAVFGDPVLYYAAKTANVPFYAYSYSGGRGYPRMTEAERLRISILIVSPEQVAAAFQKLGGEWTEARRYESPYGSILSVYRRVAKRADTAGANDAG